jgi:acyl-CoA synthetase (AMP-forming)/AMP-acid ligase II
VSSAPRRLFDLFLAAAARRPDAPAFTFVGAERTAFGLAELLATATELGDTLQARNLDARRPLGILVRSQHDQALHYLAALSAGIVPAILTPPNRKLNRAYYLETTSAVLARCSFSALVTDVGGLDIPITQLAPVTFELLDERRTGTAASESLDGVAFIQFSSGTTGFKRGVAVSPEAATAQLQTYAAALSLTPSDVILSWLPLYHDMGFIACLNMPLAHGVHSVMVDPIDWVTEPALFPRLAAEFRATLAWNPNFSYSFMAQRIRDRDLDGVDLSSLRGLVNCSEPVTRTSQERFRERFAPYGLRQDVFWGCYAMAETTFALTHGTAADDGYLDAEGPADGTVLAEPCQVSVGRPLEGVELRITGSDGKPLADRHVGELCARTPFNFNGYYNDPEATAAAHSDGFYRTGDLGYRVGDSYFVVGRKKDVLIVGGSNIFPADIEEIVGATEGVIAGRVSAYSRFDPSVQTERVTILYESAVDDDGAAAVLVAIRQRVAAAFGLTVFDAWGVPPGWLIKSSSGKMARGANRTKWEEARLATAESSQTP